MDPPYLCLLYAVTDGEDDIDLGAHQEEIVLLVYVVIDKRRNEVIGLQQCVVKPYNTKELYLSTPFLGDTFAKQLNETGVPLVAAIHVFEEYFKQAFNVNPTPQSLRFVTDGQRHLRQCLHPEAHLKYYRLPDYYNHFHDLRKEFRAFCGVPHEPECITDMITYLGIKPNNDEKLYMRAVWNMTAIVRRMLSDGHGFQDHETIRLHLQAGVYSQSDTIDSNCVVNVIGFRKLTSDQDVANFFAGLNIEKGGVALRLTKGRRNGKAYVVFENQEQCELALERHMRFYGHRYIQVYKSSGERFIRLVGGSNDEVREFLSRGAQVIIRLQNLPYNCSARKVVNFFGRGQHSCKVMGGEGGVLFVKDAKGKATGSAFVLFEFEEDATKALKKHLRKIDSRRIGLARRTTSEVQQFFKRLDPEAYQRDQLLINKITQASILPKNLIPVGTQQSCIRLKGLPSEARIKDILRFLVPYMNRVAFPGVYMIKDVQGLPYGEAFVHMNDEESALSAAQARHQDRMIIGGRWYYIEVYQCSPEHMESALINEIPAGAVTVTPPRSVAVLNPHFILDFFTLINSNPHNLYWPSENLEEGEESIPDLTFRITSPAGASAFSLGYAFSPVPSNLASPNEENDFSHQDDRHALSTHHRAPSSSTDPAQEDNCHLENGHPFLSEHCRVPPSSTNPTEENRLSQTGNSQPFPVRPARAPSNRADPFSQLLDNHSLPLSYYRVPSNRANLFFQLHDNHSLPLSYHRVPLNRANPFSRLPNSHSLPFLPFHSFFPFFIHCRVPLSQFHYNEQLPLSHCRVPFSQFHYRQQLPLSHCRVPFSQIHDNHQLPLSHCRIPSNWADPFCQLHESHSLPLGRCRAPFFQLHDNHSLPIRHCRVSSNLVNPFSHLHYNCQLPLRHYRIPSNSSGHTEENVYQHHDNRQLPIRRFRVPPNSSRRAEGNKLSQLDGSHPRT